MGFGLIESILVVGVLALFAVVNAMLAKTKNRSVFGWAIAGFLLPLSTVVLALCRVVDGPPEAPDRAD